LTFAAGTQGIVTVSFTTAVLTNAASTAITFGDVPANRQLSDAHFNPLAATYASGTVTIAAADFEADLAPRPNGDKAVTITDWVLEGLFVARLEFPTNTGEFQRADCAPRDTRGEGRLTVTDWVQAGRYAAGLDALTLAGGPTAEGPMRVALKGPGPGGIHFDPSPGTCLVRVVDATLIQGQTGTVRVNLEGTGNEAALGFSLGFDPAVFSFNGATLGSAAGGATLHVNTNQVASGKVGAVLMLPYPGKFAAGTNEVLRVGLRVSAAAAGSSGLSFGDSPVPKDVSDVNAAAEAASYINGTITIRPALPSLKIARMGDQVRLSWPDWATNFVLQTSEALVPAATWPEAGVPSVTTNGESVVTLPVPDQTKFYRLFQK
jgi:hypothetical protein